MPSTQITITCHDFFQRPHNFKLSQMIIGHAWHKRTKFEDPWSRCSQFPNWTYGWIWACVVRIRSFLCVSWLLVGIHGWVPLVFCLSVLRSGWYSCYTVCCSWFLFFFLRGIVGILVYLRCFERPYLVFVLWWCCVAVMLIGFWDVLMYRSVIFFIACVNCAIWLIGQHVLSKPLQYKQVFESLQHNQTSNSEVRTFLNLAVRQ